MSLSVVYGRTHNEAFDEICKIIKKQDKFQNIFVVVPDHATLLCENALIDALGCGGLFCVDVITLNTLAREVLGKKCESSVSSTGLLAAVKKIVLDNKEKFDVFKKVADETGFAAEIYKTILQLKSSLILPTELKNLKNSLPKGLQAKVDDITLVYNEYENFLKDDVFDGLSKFSEVIKNIKFCEKIKNSKFVFARFETLTNQTAQIVNELAKESQGVLFATVGSKNKQQVFYPDIIGSALENFSTLYAKDGGSNLYNCIYSFNSEKAAERENYKLCEFESIEEELCFVAETICNNLKCGIKEEEISIAAANLEKYKTDIKTIFARYNLSINIDEKVLAQNHSTAKFVLGLCRVFKSDFEFEEVLKLARCGAFSVSRFEIDEFENFCVKYAINHNAFLSEFKSNSSAEKVRKEILDLCFNEYINFKNSKTVCEYICPLKNAFEKMQPADDEGKIIKEKIISLFKELEFVIGGAQISYEHFISILETAISEIKISLVPVYKNAINVADAHEGFFGHVKIQFVIGANEQDFPKTENDAGLIKDSEIDVLKTSFSLSPKICDINKKNLFKTYELCFTGEKTIISYSRSEGRPSLIMLNLCQILESKIEKPLKTFGIFTKQQAELLLWRNLNSCIHSIAPVFEEEVATLAEILKANTSAAFKNTKQIFKLENAQKLHRISPSALATYGTCPFKYFLSYSIKARNKEEAQMQSVDIGSLLHKFCEEFMRIRLAGRSISPRTLMQKIGESKDFCESFKSPENAILTRQLLSEAEVIAKKLNKHYEESEFKPTLLEEKFEFNLNENLKITGKVDRLDVCKDDARVIDYKTGSKEFSLKDIYFGTDFQLAVYAQACKNYNKRFTGAFYMPLSNKIGQSGALLDGIMLGDLEVAFKMDNNLKSQNASSLINGLKLNANGLFSLLSPVASEKELNNILNYSQKQAQVFAAEIENGNIEPSCVLDNFCACDFCNFSSAFCSKVCKKRNIKKKILKGDFANGV